MAIKKSQLYSTLWESCNQLRGGMDASLYKDYVLSMLFIKYISDKYANIPFATIKIPQGSSFSDMLNLRNASNIGDDINKKIIAPLIKANDDKLADGDFPDFNDATKLGDGKERITRLTKLINIFAKPELDFSNNKAEHDDILGDAYEFLMRHFAVESGKSKGQFYTPAEVSRIIAKVIGVTSSNTSNQTTVYDPTCGSGSLLLKVASEAGKEISLYGQEKDVTTAGLAKKNMILHNFATATIATGNTLTNPKWIDTEQLLTFDYVVANPPFSDKAWITGLTPRDDKFKRFVWGEPPAKNGDYAYLLHIIRSMKSTATAACILPHGALFRGNAEAIIRKQLVDSGILQGIIGLPANLFYGTGIPACILVLNKTNAARRSQIMMVDASSGFIKDGNKNRLREQDIHKIVDVFTSQKQVTKYSRLVAIEEIKASNNDYNLNLPRYIDTSSEEDLQDLTAHMNGGIPQADIDKLQDYWQLMPEVKKLLFSEHANAGYYQLQQDETNIATTISNSKEFLAIKQQLISALTNWKQANFDKLYNFTEHPKQLINDISENLLNTFKNQPLIYEYAVYQYLMDLWLATMQDDCYLIAADGWQVSIEDVYEENKKGKQVYKGWVCELLPQSIVTKHYFCQRMLDLESLNCKLDKLSAAKQELEEEHNNDDGIFADFDKINKTTVNKELKRLSKLADYQQEITILQQWLDFTTTEAELKKQIKQQDAELDSALQQTYPQLTVDEIKRLVINDKWLADLDANIETAINRIAEDLATRVNELHNRYAEPLPQLENQVSKLSQQVTAHLQQMGVVWN